MNIEYIYIQIRQMVKNEVRFMEIQGIDKLSKLQI